MAGVKTRRATLLLFITAVIWGVAFVAQRTGMDYVGAFTFNGVRFLLGSVSLLPVIAIFEKIPRVNTRSEQETARLRYTLRAGVIGGMVLFAAASLQQVGVEITLSAGKSGFVTGLYIVLTPVLGMALGKKTGVFTWVGAVFACAGLYFLCVPSDFNIGLGDWSLLAGAFFWAVHILLIDRFAGHIYSLRFAALQFFICAALSLVCAFIFEKTPITAILAGYVPILYSGLLSVGIAYTLQIIGQRDVEPAKAALIYSTESLFAALGGAFLLGEVMEPRAYAGCALIFTGILLSQKTKRQHL